VQALTRVVRFHQTGGPEVLKIEDIPVRAPEAGEMRVRVEAIGLNRAESMYRSGAYLEVPPVPSLNGYEASAIVAELGPGVTGFNVGDAVSVIPAFSLTKYGVYADEAIVPAYAVLKRPAGLSAIEATSVWMAYLTSYGALVDIAHVAKGDAVIVTAASSSVGIAAVQMVNHLGGISIAATRTRAKAQALKDQGAHHVVVTDEEDLAAEVMKITGGKGARVAFDPAAGPAIVKLAEAASPGGIIIEYGALSSDPTPFPLFPVLAKGLTLRGYTLFEFVTNPEKVKTAAAFIYDAFAKGAFKPVVAKVFKLEDIVEAHRYLESNAQLGKVVVTAKG
jgi:NADPH:quinone reductase-like Zn-dependent oxidoreductase